MGVVPAIVLYAVIWAVTFFVALPIRLTTQGEAGDVVPGTHASAPASHGLKKKAIITSIVALVIWGAITLTIVNGWITVRDFDWFGRMSPDR